ncbi:MAG TPA: gliding motility lipoprotein GldB [Flavobacteriaceae bacterium]|nr:gliding motility lipoprotein GldB [Flavobacteriaceae bacterium]HAT66024.1 gliding motility lipoprotein GldB [Flavobacteriaceae bacterium]
MKYLVSFFFVVLLLLGCQSKSKTEEEVEKIPINLELVRFDKVFAQASPSDLENLKSQYPLFFPEQYHDSIWVEKMQDTLQKQLNDEVLKVFPSEEKLEDDLIALFQHIKYYFPDFSTPLVFTTTSDVDYRTKVIANDQFLIIEFDTYLGENHFFYEGISKYISKTMKPSQIIPDVASAYAKKYISVPTQRSFLEQMIYYGKELYLKDLWLPNVPDADKMGYTEDEMIWAVENEVEVWRYFIENELLYSTDVKLLQRFITPAPFSKFNLEIDNESPGMIGRYIGWKIVQSYMEENPVSLQQLMNKRAEEIFNDSKYKPKK